MLGLLLTGAAFCASLALGQTNIPPVTVWDALFHFDATKTQHLIIQGSRLLQC